MSNSMQSADNAALARVNEGLLDAHRARLRADLERVIYTLEEGNICHASDQLQEIIDKI